MQLGAFYSSITAQQNRGIVMRAMDIMTSEVVTVDEDASVQQVAKLLAERGISAVPVVNSKNRVMGMFS
jgi:CBS domain-containing protein